MQIESRQSIVQRIRRLVGPLRNVASNDPTKYANHESPVTVSVEIMEDIEKTLENPYRVAIVGIVSSGKSTAINKITGFSLPVGSGATTSIPIEIASHDVDEYKLTIYYKSRNQLETDLLSIAVGIHQPDGNLPSLMVQLNYPFDFTHNGTQIVQPNPYTNHPTLTAREPATVGEARLVDLIGAKPVTISYPTMDEAAAALSGFMRMPYVVDHVCVLGPFKNLPPDVVLVDTPGLGDKNHANPARTFEYVKRSDEVWYVSAEEHRLDLDVDQEFLARVAHVVGVPVHVMMTKAEELVEASAEVQESEREALRAKLRDYRAENILGGDFDQLNSPMVQLKSEQRALVVAASAAVFIGFVDCPRRGPAIGIEQWIARLHERGQVQARVTADAANDVAAIEAHLQDLATRRSSRGNVTAQEIDFWESQITQSLDAADPGDGVLNNLRVAQTRQWNTLHGTTVKAVMNPRRRGEFVSPVRGPINFNFDIAVEWANRTMQVNRNLACLETALQSIPDTANDHQRRITQSLRDMRHCYLQGGSVDFIQEHLTSLDVYSKYDRKKPPSPAEIEGTIKLLISKVRHGLGVLRTQIGSAVAALRREHVENATAEEDNHAAIQSAVREALHIATTITLEPIEEAEPGPTIVPDEEEWWNEIWKSVCVSVQVSGMDFENAGVPMTDDEASLADVTVGMGITTDQPSA
jgi:GTP-binding protein EngB required for normal cell division